MKKILWVLCVAASVVATTNAFAMTPEQALQTITSAYTQGIPAQSTYDTMGSKSTATFAITADNVRAKVRLTAQGVSEAATQKDAVHMTMQGTFTADGDTYAFKGSLGMRRSMTDLYIRLGTFDMKYNGADADKQAQAQMGGALIAGQFAGKWIKIDLNKAIASEWWIGAATWTTTSQLLSTQALNGTQDVMKKIIESVQGISPLAIGNLKSSDTYAVSLNTTWFEKVFTALGETLPADLKASIEHTVGTISTKTPEINLSMPHPDGKVGITVNAQKTTIRATDSEEGPTDIVIAKKPRGFGMSIYHGKTTDVGGMHIDASLVMPAPGKQTLKMNILSNDFSMKFGMNSMMYNAAGATISMPQDYVGMDELFGGFGE